MVVVVGGFTRFTKSNVRICPAGMYLKKTFLISRVDGLLKVTVGVELMNETPKGEKSNVELL